MVIFLGAVRELPLPRMKMAVDTEYCTRCIEGQPDEGKVLQELAHSSRSIQDILRQIYRYRWMQGRAAEQLRQRLKEGRERLKEYEQQLKEHEESLSHQVMDFLAQGEDINQIVERIMADKLRQELEKGISLLKYQSEDIDYQDLEAALKELEQEGYIDLEEGRVRITSKGAQLLAKQALKKALENLARKEIGRWEVKETGYGTELTTYSRPYELGDEYERVDIERTLLKTLEQGRGLALKPEDFHVFDLVHQTRMYVGVIIDESGSMQGDKMAAAVETSLALSELVRREPKDSLKVFIFAEKVLQIPFWDVVNTAIGKGSTDIRAAMQAFRKSAMHQRGDRQAYLITDTEPNTEDGMYVGFERAMAGVLEEALHYREQGITLNIIMLDQRPSLKEFARILARKNLGRVLFTTPQDLGAVLVEDYLRVKKEKSAV